MINIDRMRRALADIPSVSAEDAAKMAGEMRRALVEAENASRAAAALAAPKPTIPDVMPRVLAYMRRVGPEAVMHDGNIDDACIDYDIADAEQRGDDEGADLYMVLRRMSKTQRGKIRGRMWKEWSGR